ncbi:5'/3'-nucleotidase SurE [Nocardioides alcanivorans]|uniref:5'/3'-nucleotidase SurE n=1 Tax=Nocardioides alcanivorans TaxID=2897352 RepID=UPI001F2C8EF4|nr:5'/3'-nucleotidase SurE [Nocardioides alcanivorans]
MSRTALAGVAVLAVAIAATPTLVASAGPGAAPQAAPTTLPTEALDILITNDDGYDAPGINAVYDALKEAGHNVTMVAPAKNYSGVSSSIQFSGNTSASQPVPEDENIWAVDLSPAGTVLFALDVVLDEKPDLVISGTNVGSNTGFDTNFSGTIGAATIATGMQDIPALAVSTVAGYTPDAPGAYEETADLVVDLLDRGLPVLPRGQFLNINYPELTDELTEPKGVAYTANAQASAAAFTYDDSVDDPETDEIEYKVVGARGTETPAPGSDTAMLKAGWVTFGVLDADRSVDVKNVPDVAALVRALNGEADPKPQPSVSALPAKAKKNKAVLFGTSNVAKGVKAKVRWEPIANRKLKTVKQTVKTKKNGVKVKAPKAGRYLVTVKVKKMKVQGVVTVK